MIVQYVEKNWQQGSPPLENTSADNMEYRPPLPLNYINKRFVNFLMMNNVIIILRIMQLQLTDQYTNSLNSLTLHTCYFLNMLSRCHLIAGLLTKWGKSLHRDIGEQRRKQNVISCLG